MNTALSVNKNIPYWKLMLTLKSTSNWSKKQATSTWFLSATKISTQNSHYVVLVKYRHMSRIRLELDFQTYLMNQTPVAATEPCSISSMYKNWRLKSEFCRRTNQDNKGKLTSSDFEYNWLNCISYYLNTCVFPPRARTYSALRPLHTGTAFFLEHVISRTSTHIQLQLSPTSTFALMPAPRHSQDNLFLS